ncbi:MAG: NADH-quinone oxidoreductase subunit F [bacterium]|nr:NADH-quinone oxidoreductase subunit F [bacterium]
MNRLTDKCCSKCIDSEFQRCPKVTECLIKRPLAECHEDEECSAKRDELIRKIRYGNGMLLKLTACSYSPDVNIGDIMNTLFMELRRRELSHVSLTITGGLGNFTNAPFLSVSSPEKPTIVYAGVREEMVPRIIAEHIEQGRVIEEWTLGQFSDDSKKPQDSIPVIQYLDFFRNQNLRVSKRCGLIDPGNLDEYFLEGGFLALSKAVNRMTPDELINLVGVSGLRGRGEIGEHIRKKWMRMLSDDKEDNEHPLYEQSTEDHQRYLICNAHEGYEASIKDRNFLESDPFALIEGMTLAAYAVRATQGIIYINPSYEPAIQRLQNALSQVRENNYLGQEILGTDFSFDIEIRRAPAGYLVGQATAIISFLEGDVGTRSIPPYLEESGLWGCPTLIHNVETFLNIPLLVQHDFSWFTSTGPTENPGTKCLTLIGAVKHPGIIEVPLGTPLKDIVQEIGGGPLPDQSIKALHIGGPSGGYLPAERLDTPFEHDALRQLSLQMGTGTIEALNHSTCIVDRVHRHFLATSRELCGQCTAGREGIFQISLILQAIREGQNVPGCRRRNWPDVQVLLRELVEYVQAASLCFFCKDACLSLVSSQKYFQKEYEDHLQKRCKAGFCF